MKTAVATVSETGVVTPATPVCLNSTAITATAHDGSGKNSTCVITVRQSVEDLALNKTTAELYLGQPLTLTPTIVPANAYNKAVDWTSSDINVATVSAAGVVTPLQKGTATITAKTKDGSNKYASCTITVLDRAFDLTLSVPTSTPRYNGVNYVAINGTLQIGTIVMPAGFGCTYAYKSSNSKVVSVSSDGLIKGIKNGSATITVTAKGTTNPASDSKTLMINVYAPLRTVTLPTEAQMLVTKTTKLTARRSSGATEPLIWASSDVSVATVDQAGAVTAVKYGTAKVTATAMSNAAVTAMCLIQVTDSATNIQIIPAPGYVNANGGYVNYRGTMQLSAHVISTTGTAYQKVTWKSSNTAYVTVDTTGRIYGKKTGKATVYATAADGSGIRGQIAIQVITPVTGVNLPETDKVFIGKSKKLSISFSPSSPTFKALTWKSDNEVVGTVGADGTVTAMALGTAHITATAYNGFSDSCTITVTQPVDQITLTQEDGYSLVYKGEASKLNAAIAPDNASEQGVTWKSNNTKCATVDVQGWVTGKAAGKVTITATATDGSGVPGSISLTVISPETSVKLSKTSAVLYHNGETDALKSLKLTAAAAPSGTQYRKLTWSVASGDAATVDQDTGVVTVVKEGTSVIRATTDRGHFADCTVTVRTLPSSLAFTTTEKMLVFKQTFSLGTGAELQMDGTEPALTWTTSNKKVATVSASGIVKASKDKTGTVVITATTKNGLTATCTITVVKSLPKETADAYTVEVAKPTFGLRLEGGGYTTSDEGVAAVDAKGMVSLKQDGKATLEAGSKQIVVKVADGSPVELTLFEGMELALLSALKLCGLR